MFSRITTTTQSPFATPVRRRLSPDASITGLVYFFMMLFMGLAAANSQANLLFGVFGLMIGILFVSWRIGKWVLKKIVVTRLLPDHGVVGQPMTIIYEFHNEKRYWPSLSVTLAELDGAEGFTKQPHSYLLHVAAKNSASVPTEVIPKRRGLHELNHFQISTSFPFGFIKLAIDGSRNDSLLIYPPLGRVDSRLLQMARSAEKIGPTMRPRRGGMDEFYGLKEFRTGENPRWIYWRRSARTGALVAKEMTQVSPPRLMLLVDTFLQERSRPEHAAVERTIAMAASLANDALDAGLSVGLCAWSGSHWLGLPPNQGKRQCRDILAALARLPINLRSDTQSLLDNCTEYLRSGTTAILFTPRMVQIGLTERLRGSMLVVSANSPAADRWFRFDDGVDFARCMPVDQEPA